MGARFGAGLLSIVTGSLMHHTHLRSSFGLQQGGKAEHA